MASTGERWAWPTSDAQAGFLQDAGGKEEVPGAAARTKQRRDAVGLFADLLARTAVHHGKQVVRPGWQGTRAA